jgi:hypothetical protein
MLSHQRARLPVENLERGTWNAHFYSYLNASIGSRKAALRAG